MDQVIVTIPKIRIKDGDNFTVRAYFLDNATLEPDPPGTIHYRIDCLTNGAVVQDWTAATAGESVGVALAGALNAIINSRNETERKQITIVGDKDATYQRTGQAIWIVYNRHIDGFVLPDYGDYGDCYRG